MSIATNILNRLESVYPNPLPHKTLLAEVNLNSPEPIVPSVFRRELHDLIPLDVVQIDDRDRGLLYTITPRGRARIA